MGYVVAFYHYANGRWPRHCRGCFGWGDRLTRTGFVDRNDWPTDGDYLFCQGIRDYALEGVR